MIILLCVHEEDDGLKSRRTSYGFGAEGSLGFSLRYLSSSFAAYIDMLTYM